MPMLWRYTLECGHLGISGPWDDDEPQTHWIGDIISCEVCPLSPETSRPEGVFSLRQVVNVEPVAHDQYREPDPARDQRRYDHIYETHGRRRQLYERKCAYDR